MTTSTRFERVVAREVLDSRGRPTVEVDVRLVGGATGRAMVPSGASTGKHEALELRDHDSGRYNGLGVTVAVGNVNTVIGPALAESELRATDQAAVDRMLIDIDSTVSKSNLGANALLGVSMATARAGAAAEGVPLYRYLGGLTGGVGVIEPRLPLITVNIISGGAHGGQNLDMQDFLIVPVGAPDYRTSLEWSTRVRQSVAALLEAQGHHTHLVADEGGLAPFLSSHKQALDVIVAGIERAGLRPGRDADVAIAIDVAATEFYNGNEYVLATESSRLDAAGLIEVLASWTEQYPVVSIEDGLAEDDWDGWKALTERIGDRTLLIGDDLFTTNPGRLQRGVETGAANGVLVKLNQIGTLTETLQVIEDARQAGYIPVVSARSGETEDAFIADLAVGVAAPQFKVGSTTRSERTAKWNQLLRIEEELGAGAAYAGRDAFGR
ncbi:MAG: phosphopyruvate hydratase [Dehalococcoidia bacterium]